MTDNSSLFNNDTQVDSQTMDDSSVDPVEVLVGEGKKFKDFSALAKGKLAADAHIARLERENAEKDRKLQEAATLERLMAELKLSKPASKTTTDAIDEEEVDSFSRAVPEVDPNVIAEKVMKTLEEKQRKAQYEQNQNLVAQELQNIYGANWRKEVTEWAKENDVPLDTLDSLAKRSPKGFFKTLGIQPKSTQSNSSLFNTKVNTVATSSSKSSGHKTQKEWSAMRKTNPNLYNDPKMQLKMFEDAKALGDDFYR